MVLVGSINVNGLRNAKNDKKYSTDLIQRVMTLRYFKKHIAVIPKRNSNGLTSGRELVFGVMELTCQKVLLFL